jgi:hypothetical protein
VQFDQPSTELWVQLEEVEIEIESSGDSVLDSLRVQLRKHGKYMNHLYIYAYYVCISIDALLEISIKTFTIWHYIIRDNG